MVVAAAVATMIVVVVGSPVPLLPVSLPMMMKHLTIILVGLFQQYCLRRVRTTWNEKLQDMVVGEDAMRVDHFMEVVDVSRSFLG